MLDRPNSAEPPVDQFHSVQFVLAEAFYQRKEAIEEWFSEQGQTPELLAPALLVGCGLSL